MTSSRRLTALLAAALGALSLAWYAVTGHVATLPTPAAKAVSISASQAQLPITAYEPTPTQAAQTKYLTQRLTQLCMRGFGFAYDPELSTSTITEGVRIDQEFQSRMYGVSDPVAVRTYGYHLPSWTQGSAAPELASDLPTAEESVLDGTVATYDRQTVPQGGCTAWAGTRLAQRGIDPSSAQPGGVDAEALAVQLQTTTFEQAQSDPRVLAVFSEWSACMRAAGDDYASPFAAAGDPRWETSAATGQEIKTAGQDLVCKLRVNVSGVEAAVWSDYQNAAIARNAAALGPVKARMARQAAALQSAMAQYGA